MANQQIIPLDPLATKHRWQSAPQVAYETTRLSPSRGTSRVNLAHLGTMSFDFSSCPDILWSEQTVRKKASEVPELIPTNPSEFKLYQPKLISIVAEAKKRLKEAFGKGAIVNEELVVPDDDGKAYPILFLIAQVDLPVENAREIMRNLDESWWLDQLEAVQGKVQLDFEFR